MGISEENNNRRLIRLYVESDICMYVQRPRARYSHMLTREGPYFLCVAFLTVRASMSFECVDSLLQFLK